MDQSELLAKKKEVLDEARAIHARVQNEQNGEWRGDEEAKWDGLMKQSDKYQAEVERMARMDSAEKLLAGADTSTGRRSRSARLPHRTPIWRSAAGCSATVRTALVTSIAPQRRRWASPSVAVRSI
jgi:anti-sigma-K factor RskA